MSVPQAPSPPTPRKRRVRLVTFVVLACALAVTWLGWTAARFYVEQQESARFELRTRDVRSAILRNMESYLALLRSGERFFAASEEVNRQDWAVFTDSARLAHLYPGLQGLGFAAWLDPRTIADFPARARRVGVPDLRVWTADGQRPRSSILFLEPPDWRNRRAIGFDMMSEPRRRAAMQQAADTGQPVMSGKVRLVQETHEQPQAGFLIYVPVYAPGARVDTVAARRSALRGFVYSPFRADDLFRAIEAREPLSGLEVEIYDGEGVSRASLLYDQRPPEAHGGGPGPYQPARSHTEALELAHHRWTLYICTLPGFDAGLPVLFPGLVALAGLILSFILAGLVYTLATSEARALALAQAMTADLRAADRLKDEFLSVISHELRTPLNFITGFASILDDELAGPLEPRQHEAVSKILRGSDMMLGLVDNLLDMSRMAAGKFRLDARPAAMGPVVAEAVASMRPLAAEQGIELVEAVDGDAWVVMDAARISQVLNNLISNAIKFTPPGGRIAVTATAAAHEARFAVTDTGVGIALADQGRLFQRFSQLDMGDTRPVGGTGLGLSISKGIVEAHGGLIGVRSTPGQGATFWFTLPRKASANS